MFLNLYCFGEIRHEPALENLELLAYHLELLAYATTDTSRTVYTSLCYSLAHNADDDVGAAAYSRFKHALTTESFL